MGVVITESIVQVFSLLTRQMHGAIIWKKNEANLQKKKEIEKLIVYIIDEKYLEELRKHKYFSYFKKFSDHFVNPECYRVIYLFEGTEMELEALFKESLGFILEHINRYNFGNTLRPENKDNT